MGLQVKVMTFLDAFKVYENVSQIRIKSKDYTLLIMEDYISTIGEINGDISFVTKDDEIILDNIEGFYCLKDNVFSLLIKDNKPLQ